MRNLIPSQGLKMVEQKLSLGGSHRELVVAIAKTRSLGSLGSVSVKLWGCFHQKTKKEEEGEAVVVAASRKLCLVHLVAVEC